MPHKFRATELVIVCVCVCVCVRACVYETAAPSRSLARPATMPVTMAPGWRGAAAAGDGEVGSTHTVHRRPWCRGGGGDASSSAARAVWLANVSNVTSVSSCASPKPRSSLLRGGQARGEGELEGATGAAALVRPEAALRRAVAAVQWAALQGDVCRWTARRGDVIDGDRDHVPPRA